MTDTPAEVAAPRCAQFQRLMRDLHRHTLDDDFALVWNAAFRAGRESLQSQLAAQRERDGRLRDACEGLLAFIREKYPQDFADGGRGYICPHHLAIDAALKDRP